ncbi:MAG: Lrp/AsnC ligand binding domain-containing protein [Candidatus Omnitrophica bacterium]|nr:Lrp/AsnC ligand binding domain-containing protein [Candidatus Omnitrophota bacterium]
MAKAYLKVIVEAGKEKEIKEALLKVSGIGSVDLTAGEQDIIAVITAGSYEEILKLVVNSIRPIAGIKSTSTNLVLE